MSSAAAKKTVAILGGGFGGVQTALAIGRALRRHKLTEKYQVVLIDRNTYHTFSPTLYEAATTTDYIASNSQLKRIVTFSLKEICAGLPITVQQGRVTSISAVASELVFESGTALSYNWLVVAVGSQVNFFNIPGLAEHALPLKSFADALRIRERIITHVEQEQRPAIRVIIGGGGPTGVELAGEIKNLLHELPRVCAGECSDSVTIIDGGPTVLSAFHPGIIKKAVSRLDTLDIQRMNNERIQSVESDAVVLQSGARVPYDVLLWTGGVTAHELTRNIQLKKDPTGTRILASHAMLCVPESEDLHITSRIYGIGDAVCFIDPATNRPVPGVARAAIVQGTIAAHNIIQEILAEEDKAHTITVRRYHPRQYPYILPIGGKYAIAKFGPIIYGGVAGWITKGLVEFAYLLSIYPVSRALYYWLHGLWIFLRNDRLG